MRIVFRAMLVLVLLPSPDVARASGEPTVDPRFVTAQTEFGLKLFSELRTAAPAENVFISPPSIAIALAMTANGASGETRDAMFGALELKGTNLDEMNGANQALLRDLQGRDPEATLRIANSLWAEQSFPFKPDFMRRVAELYSAEVASLPFDSGAVQRINDWVGRRTEGRIEHIVDRIGAYDVLFLINAIYFEGKWRDPFDPSATRDRPFTLLDGMLRNVPMMMTSGRYPYQEAPEFQAVRLPYGDGELSMIVFLPAAGSGLDAFCETLSAESWTTWMDRFRPRRGTVFLPRFEISYGAELEKALSALGMGIAFDRNRADFGEMCTARVFISNATHKTFLKVDEEGTEAAGATSIRMETLSVDDVDDSFHMAIDRPFFCAVHDRRTDAVLFVGAIVDPEEGR